MVIKTDVSEQSCMEVTIMPTFKERCTTDSNLKNPTSSVKKFLQFVHLIVYTHIFMQVEERQKEIQTGRQREEGDRERQRQREGDHCLTEACLSSN